MHNLRSLKVSYSSGVIDLGSLSSRPVLCYTKIGTVVSQAPNAPAATYSAIQSPSTNQNAIINCALSASSTLC